MARKLGKMETPLEAKLYAYCNIFMQMAKKGCVPFKVPIIPEIPSMEDAFQIHWTFTFEIGENNEILGKIMRHT